MKYKSENIYSYKFKKRYISKVNNLPLLTLKEEKMLIKKFRKNNDFEAFNKLIESHLRLVVKMVFKYFNHYTNLFDLIQEGNIGIMKALKKFDPRKKIRFSTYIQWWIKGFILKYLLDNHSIIRLGRTTKEKYIFYSLNKARDRLANAGHNPDDSSKLAEILQENEEKIIEMNNRINKSVISLDQPINNNSAITVLDFIKTDYSNVETEIIKNDLNKKLEIKFKNFANSLTEKEKIIWNKRMIVDNPERLRQIGNVLKISQERVRQIGEEIKMKLKKYLIKQKDFIIEDYIKD